MSFMDGPLTQVAVKPKGTNKTYEGVTKNETNIFVPTATVVVPVPVLVEAKLGRHGRFGRTDIPWIEPRLPPQNAAMPPLVPPHTADVGFTVVLQKFDFV